MSGITPEAVGVEVRIGRSGRENAATKATRYLVEGRVQVRHVAEGRVKAYVRGQGEVYEITYALERGWHCTCAARSLCAHVIALKQVVVVAGGGMEMDRQTAMAVLRQVAG